MVQSWKNEGTNDFCRFYHNGNLSLIKIFFEKLGGLKTETPPFLDIKIDYIDFLARAGLRLYYKLP